jgi:FkbM family methyltransferase
MRLRDFTAANDGTLAEAERVRPVTTSDILRDLRRKHPYRGFVEIDSKHCPPFVTLCLNDDAVALDTVWNGGFTYEPGSLAVWSRLAAKSNVVADVGAHVGYFSLIAALANKKATVHAFEPVDTIYSRLLVNQRANGIINITPHHTGVSNREGWTELGVRFANSLLSTGSSLERVDSPEGTKFLKVPLTTLDVEFADTPLDLMKIDVEGHELSVLEGGARVLERDRPTVILEALADASMEPLLKIFEPLGYDVHWISEYENSLVPMDKGRPHKSRNLIFQPASKKGFRVPWASSAVTRR